VTGELIQGLTFAAVLGAAIRVEHRLTTLESSLRGLSCVREKPCTERKERRTMKDRFNRFLLCLALLGLVAAVGCSSPAAPIQKVVTVQTTTNATEGGHVAIVTHTNIIYRVSETWETGLQAGQTVAPLAPGGWGGVVTAALGLLSFALAGCAKVLNARANRADTIARVVIQGVELANQPQTKEAVAKVAATLGIGQELDKKVQDLTR
jgi:hypothetical protein